MMNKNELSNLLLHYGRLTTDSGSLDVNNGMYNECIRIRTFSYNGKAFYHHMIDGVVVECFELT